MNWHRPVRRRTNGRTKQNKTKQGGDLLPVFLGPSRCARAMASRLRKTVAVSTPPTKTMMWWRYFRMTCRASSNAALQWIGCWHSCACIPKTALLSSSTISAALPEMFRRISNCVKLCLMQAASLESPSIEFGEDSDSRLVEHMLASVAQHQREKNAEQTSNRMKGRMMNGYSVFSAPVGYKYKKTGSHGKLLTRDEPIASIVKEALEGYASGRFSGQADIKRFLENQPEFPKDLPNGQIRQQKVTDMLNRVIYAGYMEHEPWGITRRKGHHEALISLETYETIQDASEQQRRCRQAP